MAKLPSGTVTLLFTDVEGSTRLLEELGSVPYAAVLAEHRRVLREAAAAHDGVEVDTQGDALFFAFHTARGALTAAAEAQAALAAGPISVRMGVHTGEPLCVDGGYVGIDVHRAARISAAGHGGQVLVSESTRALTGSEGMLDLGVHRLKDLSAAERIYQLGGRSFPALKTLHRTNLPVPATPFLGRESELADVVGLLARDDVQLLTLTGPGGVGKTRLALQAAAELGDAYAGGITWVPLAVLRDPAAVLPAIAAACDVHRSGERELIEAIARQLAGRRSLLVIDNFEQVIDAARDIAALGALASNVDILVTSREPLTVAGEREYPVASLRRRDAVALFVERASAVRPDFRSSGAISELCERLDGLPLAIELAAARTRALSPEALVERLGRRLDLLRGGRDLDPRQQTLRATIAWSYDLLEPGERELFAKLAIFAGGCRLEEAELVCGADAATLAALVDKSLLRRRVGSDGTDRFWMLETIREFALERLTGLPGLAALRQLHAERYLDLAEAARADFDSHGLNRTQLDRVAAEEGNLREALVTLRKRPQFELVGRLCAALFLHWFFRGDPREGAGWAATALAGEVSEPTRAALENERAALLYHSGGALDEALALAHASVERFRRLGDKRGLVYALTTVGNILATSSAVADEAGARAAYGDALHLARERRAAWWERTLLANLGYLNAISGRFPEARDALMRARELAVAANDEVAQAIDTVHLAGVEADLGNWPTARAMAAQGIAATHELGLRPWVLWGLLAAARVEAAAGSPQRAARIFGALQAQIHSSGFGLGEIDGRAKRATEATLRDLLGSADFENDAREGATLMLADAVALALNSS